MTSFESYKAVIYEVFRKYKFAIPSDEELKKHYEKDFPSYNITCKNSGCLNPATLKIEPSRHFMSPNSINYDAKNDARKYYNWYCSPKCRDYDQGLTYAFLAELDKNASDGDCFEHDNWEGEYRIGKCNITGERIRVIPLQPGDRSGQPQACYDHFKLRLEYQKTIDEYYLK